MKKDLVFAPILLVLGVLLFLLKQTGMVAHIVLSVVGILALVVYTVVSKKEWKLPPLEILMRLGYGVAFITGVILKINYIPALSMVHKAGAALFVLLLLAVSVHKAVSKKK